MQYGFTLNTLPANVCGRQAGAAGASANACDPDSAVAWLQRHRNLPGAFMEALKASLSATGCGPGILSCGRFSGSGHRLEWHS